MSMIIRKIIRSLIKVITLPRIIFYRFLSLGVKFEGTPKFVQPTILLGKGKISFGKNVQLGYFPSPSFFNNYIHIEARHANSQIIFGDNIYINNGCKIISGYHSVKIGNNVMIGTNCEIIDNDFHDKNPQKRIIGDDSGAIGGAVEILDNAFIGSNVTIMKNVKIGKNSVIGNGSIVTKSIPDNRIAAGNPAKVIKSL